MPKTVRVTFSEWRDRVTKKWGPIFDFTEAEQTYTKVTCRVWLTCTRHNVRFNVGCSNLQYAHGGCKPCLSEYLREVFTGRSGALPFEIWEERFRAQFGDKFNYEKARHLEIGWDKLIPIVCPIHGDFKARPATFANSKFGCHKCQESDRRTKARARLGEEDNDAARYRTWVAAMKERWRDRFEFPDEVPNLYKSPKIPVICIAGGHGRIMVTMRGMANSKTGCYQCGRVSCRGPRKIREDGSKQFKRVMDLHQAMEPNPKFEFISMVYQERPKRKEGKLLVGLVRCNNHNPPRLNHVAKQALIDGVFCQKCALNETFALKKQGQSLNEIYQDRKNKKFELGQLASQILKERFVCDLNGD